LHKGRAMTINKSIIRELNTNNDVYVRGEKYYRDGKLLSLKAEDRDGGSVVHSVVEGNYKNYEVTLKLNANGSLKEYSCTCESQNIWHGACKHVVASLFALAEGHASADSAAKRQARALTDALERLVFDEIDAELAQTQPPPVNPVRLTPCFHYDSRGEAFLSFMAGYERMYVIKSLQSFIASVRRE